MQTRAQIIRPSAGIQRVAILSCLMLSVILTIFPTIAHSAKPISLTWSANAESNVAGYKIHYGYETGNYEYSVDVGNQTSYTVQDRFEKNASVYFVVTAYDSAGNESGYSKQVVHNTVNQPAVPDAGPDQTLDTGVTATLSGINSSDPEGGAISYLWEQIGGPAVTLSDSTSARPTFTTPDDVGTNGESLTFRLRVTDNEGLESEDYCIVNVTWDNIPPTADAGTGLNVDEGEQVTLNGLGSSDGDDQIVTYLWEQIGGRTVEIVNPTAARATFEAPYLVMKNVSVIMVNDPGGLEALTFQLTVTDGRGLTSTDTCVVNVAWTNTPPTANAGQDQTTSRGQTLTLDGSGSMDPDDGLASVWWTQTRGTPVELSDPTALQPTFTAPTIEGDQEALAFELTVMDKTGLASQDTCVITLS